MRPQDFLDDKIEGPLGALAERREIGLRDRTARRCDRSEGPRSRRRRASRRSGHGRAEDRRKLHPQPGQVVDVEKPPIVDLVLRDAEEGDAPMLRLDQPIELAPVAIKASTRPSIASSASASSARQLREVRLEAGARSATCGRQFGRSRKRSPIRSRTSGDAPEDRRIGQRSRPAACGRRKPRRRRSRPPRRT